MPLHFSKLEIGTVYCLWNLVIIVVHLIIPRWKICLVQDCLRHWLVKVTVWGIHTFVFWWSFLAPEVLIQWMLDLMDDQAKSIMKIEKSRRIQIMTICRRICKWWNEPWADKIVSTWNELWLDCTRHKVYSCFQKYLANILEIWGHAVIKLWCTARVQHLIEGRISIRPATKIPPNLTKCT